eukprot:jgi/Psemu1/23261/gm1.23261_g
MHICFRSPFLVNLPPNSAKQDLDTSKVPTLIKFVPAMLSEFSFSSYHAFLYTTTSTTPALLNFNPALSLPREARAPGSADGGEAGHPVLGIHTLLSPPAQRAMLCCMGAIRVTSKITLEHSAPLASETYLFIETKPGTHSAAHFIPVEAVTDEETTLNQLLTQCHTFDQLSPPDVHEILEMAEQTYSWKPIPSSPATLSSSKHNQQPYLRITRTRSHLSKLSGRVHKAITASLADILDFFKACSTQTAGDKLLDRIARLERTSAKPTLHAPRLSGFNSLSLTPPAKPADMANLQGRKQIKNFDPADQPPSCGAFFLVTLDGYYEHSDSSAPLAFDTFIFPVFIDIGAFRTLTQALLPRALGQL